MRILVVNTGFLPVPPDKGGSIELHAYYLSNELAKLGNEVHFVTSVNPRASFHKRVVLHKLPRIPFNFHGNYLQTLVSFGSGGFFAFLRAMHAIASNKYDVVHIHGHVPGFFLLSLTKKSRSVFTVHNPNPWMVKSFSEIKQAFRVWAFKKIELKIVKHVDCVIAVSENLRDEFVYRFKVDPQKIKVIPNGVDINFFRPSINSEDILSKYQLPNDYILFVGRLVEQKGVDILLKALKGTNINLVVVGGGPLFTFYNEMCNHLNITRQVRFIGSVPLCDLRKIYSQAMFLVIPSIAEGFPGGLVTLEAMSSGLPVIASNIKGIEKIIFDGYNGLLFDVGNVEELRSHIIWLCKDRSLRRAMGARSRKIAESQYSWERVAKKTHLLYKEIS